MPIPRRRSRIPADPPEDPYQRLRRVPRFQAGPMRSLVALLCSLASQDVARANAGLATIRIQNRLRQQAEVDAYLEQLAEERALAAEHDIAQRATG